MSGDKPLKILEHGQEQWAKKGEGAPSPDMFPHSEAIVRTVYFPLEAPSFLPPRRWTTSPSRLLRALGTQVLYNYSW